jgi:hypothetical protein
MEEESILDVMGPGWFFFMIVVIVLYAILWGWLAIREIKIERERKRRLKALADYQIEQEWLMTEQDCKDRMP